MTSTSASDRRVRGLKNRKRSVISSFSSIASFVNNFSAERDTLEVPVRLETLNALWTEFNKVQTELEEIEEKDEILEAMLKERTEVEKAYYRSKGMLLFHNRSSSEQPTNQPRSGEPSRTMPQVRLPDVKLPIFAGEFESWLNFHDMFVSLVHTSEHLSTIQKFYYLRSSLSGEALKLIQTIPICNEQYLIAWKMLEDHYSNPRRLQKAYIQTLFEFPCMKEESATILHSLIERFEANVKILKQLGEHTEHWDALLIHLLSTRLDSVTRRDWEEHAEANKTTKFVQLIDFLQQRVNVLQTVSNGSSTNPPLRSTTTRKVETRAAYESCLQQDSQQCVVCSNDHSLYQCETFSGMTIKEKQNFVRSNHLCWNCLRRGHLSRECSSGSCCRKCGARHHTLLCATPASKPQGSSHPSIQAHQHTQQDCNNDSSDSTVGSYSGVASSSKGRTSTVLLATAFVNLLDDNGTEHTVRALLDSGSELCFATEELCQRMKVHRNHTSLPVAGIGQGTTEVHSKFQSIVNSRITNYSRTIDFHVLPTVTVDLPSRTVDTAGWPLPTGIQFADPSFHTSRPVDIVLGAEVFFDLFGVQGQIVLGDSLPSLINSKLGWIVSGNAIISNTETSVVCNAAVMGKSRRHNETTRTPLQCSRVNNHRFGNVAESDGPKTASNHRQQSTQQQRTTSISATQHRPSSGHGQATRLNERYERFFTSLDQH